MDIVVLRFFSLLDPNNAHGEEFEVGVNIVNQPPICVFLFFCFPLEICGSLEDMLV